MFGIGWTELLIIAIVAIVVVGPKDLPRLTLTALAATREAQTDLQKTPSVPIATIDPKIACFSS
jgi:sec-independent protein translocase protein TatB